MSPLKFIKNVSETYFSEKAKAWKNSKRWWSFLFVAFFALYLLQIYGAFTEWSMLVVNYSGDGAEGFDSDAFWQNHLAALYLQGMVLLGVFIRFLSSQFRGKWFVRFGELGEFIAFAAFLRHCLWTREVYSDYVYANICTSPSLIGLIPAVGQWLSLLFLGWIFYKVIWIIAVVWNTVRK